MQPHGQARGIEDEKAQAVASKGEMVTVQKVSVDDKLRDAINGSERKLGFLESFAPTKETQQSRISIPLE